MVAALRMNLAADRDTTCPPIATRSWTRVAVPDGSVVDQHRRRTATVGLATPVPPSTTGELSWHHSSQGRQPRLPSPDRAVARSVFHLDDAHYRKPSEAEEPLIGLGADNLIRVGRTFTASRACVAATSGHKPAVRLLAGLIGLERARIVRISIG